MAGIYIHIPFCKSHCSYCDFYSVTGSDKAEELVNAICLEIELRKDYVEDEIIETIYFGGGTPSFISTEYFKKILQKIYAVFPVSDKAEITLEVNPDDITVTKATEYLKIGFNRVSMGVQSFNDKYLSFLNRRHNSSQACKSIEILKMVGFSNISIDLIYGIPGMTQKEWETVLENAVSVDVNHISAYHLTFEKGTDLYVRYKTGDFILPEDTESEKSYMLLCEMLNKKGYEHYEISNFSKPGFSSKHNRSYWEDKKYLGLGPSAHSYNGISRQWNISDNNEYINEVLTCGNYFKIEKLSNKDKYNEYLITHLRTNLGISKKNILKSFGSAYLNHFLKQIKKQVELKNIIELENNKIIIPENKWFISDGIISDCCKA